MSLPRHLPVRMIDGFNNNVQLPFNVTASPFFNYSGLEIVACSISEFNYETLNVSDIWMETLNGGCVKVMDIHTVSRETRTLRAKYLKPPKPCCIAASYCVSDKYLCSSINVIVCEIHYVLLTNYYLFRPYWLYSGKYNSYIYFLCLLVLPTQANVYTMGIYAQVFKFLCLCYMSFI